MNKNIKLVYSTDPKDQSKIVDDDHQPTEDSVKSRNFVAIFRIEKNGRGGKVVTVIDGLPKIEIFLKDLTRELKAKCGTGGTHDMSGKDGIIEIQGDKRDAIKKIFAQKGIRFKGM